MIFIKLNTFLLTISRQILQNLFYCEIVTVAQIPMVISAPNGQKSLIPLKYVPGLFISFFATCSPRFFLPESRCLDDGEAECMMNDNNRCKLGR